MVTSRLVALLKTIVVFSALPTVGMATVGQTEQCIGLAIVSPPGSDYGTIYVSHEIVQDLDGNYFYPRMGYLPSGTIINLQKPKKGETLHKIHCGFHYRDAVVGHIDRRHITKLDNAIQALRDFDPNWANLKDHEIAFISPADPSAKLNLYETSDVRSTAKPVEQFGRNDRTVILLPREHLREQRDAIEVLYLSDVNKASLKKAFIKKEDNRDYNRISGTYRIFETDATSNSSETTTAKKFDIEAYLRSVGVPDSAIEKLKKKAKLGACGHAEKVDVDVGVGLSIFIKVSVSGNVSWLKPANENYQTARFGRKSQLIVAGTAHCDYGRYPSALKSAEITIGGESFVIVSDQFFNHISSRMGSIRSLRKYANRQTGRHKYKGITQMINIPYLKTNPVYYKYIDEFEDYMYRHVLRPSAYRRLKVDDQYGLMLSVGEILTNWDPK